MATFLTILFVIACFMFVIGMADKNTMLCRGALLFFVGIAITIFSESYSNVFAWVSIGIGILLPLIPSIPIFKKVSPKILTGIIVGTLVVALAICIPLMMQEDSNYKSNYDYDKGYGYTEPKPGESLNDYIKRQDPDLYSDMEDRWNSLDD